jgi:hypothetical protein
VLNLDHKGVRYTDDFIFNEILFRCIQKVDEAGVEMAVKPKSAVPPSLWQHVGQEVCQNIIKEILRIELFLGNHEINNVKAVNTPHHYEHKF